MKTTVYTKRPIIIVVSILLILLSVLSLASCSFDESKNNYRGGELIDKEKISEIKNQLLGAGSDSDENAESTLRDTEGTERNETERPGFGSGTAIFVYWTDGGSVWHLSRDCYHIKNKEVTSGTLSEAEESGHKTACKTCNKNGS